MNNNPLGDFGEKAFEQLEDVKNTAVREVKSMPKVAKSQIQGSPVQTNDTNQTQETRDLKQDKNKVTGDKKIDPITGKPVPSKKMLSQLSQATAQVARMKMKKIREELEKQRLKVGNDQQVENSKKQDTGPEIKLGSAKPKDDIVQKTLKASKSTGEIKGLIGG